MHKDNILQVLTGFFTALPHFLIGHCTLPSSCHHSKPHPRTSASSLSSLPLPHLRSHPHPHAHNHCQALSLHAVMATHNLQWCLSTQVVSTTALQSSSSVFIIPVWHQWLSSTLQLLLDPPSAAMWYTGTDRPAPTQPMLWNICVSPARGDPFCRARPEAVLPETESPDSTRCVGPVVDGSLQALQPPVRDGLGVKGLPAEHGVLEVGGLRRRKGHWAQVIAP